MVSYSSASAVELIRACADAGGSGAWQEFVRRYQRPIALSILRTVGRWGMHSREIVDDLVQETYLKLCADQSRHLMKFSVEHPEAIDGYIRATAVNVAHDYIKSQRSAKRGSGATIQFPEHVEAAVQPESEGGQEAIWRGLVMREIDHCLEQFSDGATWERDRLIFWLHYQQGMSASAIAALPAIDLTTKGVESVLFRLIRQIRERLTPLLREKTAKPRPTTEGFGALESY